MKKEEDLFFTKYYEMSDEDLEKEAGKYKIGGYFNGSIIIRERIIEQLIRKDLANITKSGLIISKRILTISLVTVGTSICALVVAIIAIFLK